MNFQLILGVSILQLLIAFLWFSPKLFGGIWNRINRIDGLSKHEIRELRKSAIPFYVLQFLLQFVTNTIIYVAVANAGFVGGAFAFLVWLGFMMPLVVQNEICTKLENIPKLKRIFIVGGLFLVITVLAGLIFGFFR